MSDQESEINSPEENFDAENLSNRPTDPSEPSAMVPPVNPDDLKKAMAEADERADLSKQMDKHLGTYLLIQFEHPNSIAYNLSASENGPSRAALVGVLNKFLRHLEYEEQMEFNMKWTQAQMQQAQEAEAGNRIVVPNGMNREQRRQFLKSQLSVKR